MFSNDEAIIKQLIGRYQKKIFALTLYLIGGDRDKAYELTVASFAEAIRATPLLFEENVFLAALTRAAVKEGRNAEALPSPVEVDLVNASPQKKQILATVQAALQKLPFDSKAALLLRDQLNCTYEAVGSALAIPAKEAKRLTTKARIQLRERLEEIIGQGG